MKKRFTGFALFFRQTPFQPTLGHSLTRLQISCKPHWKYAREAEEFSVREPCGENLLDFLTWLFQLLGISQVCVLCKKCKVANERIFISIGCTP